MRAKERQLLGIDIQESEIRLALVSERNGSLTVETVAHTNLPSGSVGGGAVIESGVLAVALRRLIDGCGLSHVKDVVLGVPSGGTIVRNVLVPSVPDEELPGIVAGEVEHYKIVSVGGAHAYIRLHPPMKVDHDQIPVIVAAAEERVISGLKDLASRASINIVALEPAEFAMFRSTIAAEGPKPTAFLVAVSEAYTDIAFLREGQFWAYRQLDTGSATLLHRIERRQAPRPPQPGDEFQIQSRYDRNAASSLAREIKRTLEYLAREYRDQDQIQTVLLSVSEPALSGLPQFLADFLHKEVRLVDAGEGVDVAISAQEDCFGPEGLRYTAAIGLAMRSSPELASVVPPVDLFASERSAVKAGAVRRNLVASMVASGVLLLAGILLFAMLYLETNRAQSEVALLNAQAQSIAQKTNVAQKERASHLEQYQILRSQGAPLVPLMDMLSSRMPPQTGLTNVTVESGLVLRISGESKDQSGVMETMRALQSVPVVQKPRLDSMREDLEDDGLEFSIVGSLVGMDRVKTGRVVSGS